MATSQEVSAQPLRRPATLDHLRKRQPREATLPICVSDEAAAEMEDATAALLSVSPLERAGAEERLAKAWAAVQDETVTIRVRAIGHKAYERLLMDHPPTDDQVARAAKVNRDTIVRFNPETFPAALVAASVIVPPLTVAEAGELMDQWNTEEAGELFYTCQVVNERSRSLDLPKGFLATGA